MKRLLLLVALCFECYSVIPNEEIGKMDQFSIFNLIFEINDFLIRHV